MGQDAVPPILEKKYVFSLILKVKNQPGLTKTELMATEDAKGNDRTRFLRISELIDAGIFTVDMDNRQHNTMHIYLTNKGQVIASYLEKIIDTVYEM